MQRFREPANRNKWFYGICVHRSVITQLYGQVSYSVLFANLCCHNIKKDAKIRKTQSLSRTIETIVINHCSEIIDIFYSVCFWERGGVKFDHFISIFMGEV